MPFCSKCGARVLGAACQFCGKPVEAAQLDDSQARQPDWSDAAPPIVGEGGGRVRDDVVVVDAQSLNAMRARLAELEEAQASESDRRAEMIPLVSFTTTSQPKEKPPQVCPGCGAPVAGAECKYCGRRLGDDPAGAGPMVAFTVALSDNIAGGLSYLLGPVTAGYFLVTEPYNRNPKVRFHALQSMYLSLTTLAAIFVLPFVGVLLQLLSSALGNFFAALWFSLYMVPFVVWMAVTFRAFSGSRLVLSIIGTMAAKQAG